MATSMQFVYDKTGTVLQVSGKRQDTQSKKETCISSRYSPITTVVTIKVRGVSSSGVSAMLHVNRVDLNPPLFCSV